MDQIKTIRIRNLFIVLFLLAALGLCQLALGAEPKINSVLTGLQDIMGEYHGDVRLQSPDGKVDRLLVPHAQLSIGVLEDELVLKASTDLLGENCQSRVGSIRELLKFPTNQPHILRAVFDFDARNCQTKVPLDSLVIFLIRDQDNTITLETLLSHGTTDLETRSPAIQNLNVHGYFTKKEPQLSAS